MEVKAGKDHIYELYKEINSKAGTSKKIMEFGEKWANAMEATRKPVAEVAMATAKELNKEFQLSTFEFMCAMSSLTFFWEHGRELYFFFEKEDKLAKGEE